MGAAGGRSQERVLGGRRVLNSRGVGGGGAETPAGMGGVVGERRPLLVGGAQDSEAGGRGLLCSQNASHLVRGPLQVCFSWAQTIRPCGRASERSDSFRVLCSGTGLGTDAPELDAPGPLRCAAGLRGSFVSGSVSRHLWAPLPPGLSAEWRVAGPLVCGGRREEIEEWF